MEKPIQVSLSYKEGSSDKVYQAALEKDKAGTGWVVNFAYGRRGSTLQVGTKTQKPVDYTQAEKIFSKLITEKQAKGYKVDSGDVSVPVPTDKKQTNYHAQLLKALEEDEVDKYLEDDEYLAQEKMDGERRKILKEHGKLTGINRKAQEVALTDLICRDITVRTHYSRFLLDGEQIGDNYYVFDLLILGDQDLRGEKFSKRYGLLTEFVQEADFKHIKLVKAVGGFVPKMIFYKQLLQENKEGIVFKNRNAKYIPGRNSGTQFKYKFYETASFLVTNVNDKRSVQISVMMQGAVIFAGNVTIPVNHQVPEIGDIIEVRYLYAYRGGSVYQPTYLGLRTDLEKTDCDISQLKYKGEHEETEAEA